jgi:hypothetical protein
MLQVILCVDTEPDRPIFGSSSFSERRGELKMRGIEYYAEKIEETVKGFEDSFGNEGKISWFLRADSMIKMILGACDYIFKEYHHQWRKFKDDNDEICWHPHTIKWEKCWRQELDDKEWMIKMLVETYEKIPPVESTRMGWHYQNNEIMNTLDTLGIRRDVSALPGMNSDGRSLFIKLMNTANGTTKSNVYDWSRAPKVPFHPARYDYQSEGEMNILEIPITTLKGKSWVFCSNINKTRASIESSIENDICLVGEMHADDLLTQDKKIYNIIGKKYTLENIADNLRYLISLASKSEFEFKTAKTFSI